MLRTGGIDPNWLMSFFSDACEASWTASSDDYVLDNPEWRKFTGQSQAEVEGEGWAKALHPEDQTRALEDWRKAVANGSVYSCAFRVRYLDGKYRNLLSVGTPIRKRDGSVFQWFGASFRLPGRATDASGFQHADLDDVAPAHLKAARAALGWSINTMSKLSGLSPMTLRRLEGAFTDIRASKASLERVLKLFANHGVTMLINNSLTVVAIERIQADSATQGSTIEENLKSVSVQRRDPRHKR